mmetsp:Transcript_26/g.59  ORF Transcript_26/g.59 Transcript_26/m.59 type:complete len:336 (+) Transcript_26:999-2006(+)
MSGVTWAGDLEHRGLEDGAEGGGDGGGLQGAAGEGVEEAEGEGLEGTCCRRVHRRHHPVHHHRPALRQHVPHRRRPLRHPDHLLGHQPQPGARVHAVSRLHRLRTHELRRRAVPVAALRGVEREVVDRGELHGAGLGLDSHRVRHPLVVVHEVDARRPLRRHHLVLNRHRPNRHLPLPRHLHRGVLGEAPELAAVGHAAHAAQRLDLRLVVVARAHLVVAARKVVASVAHRLFHAVLHRRCVLFRVAAVPATLVQHLRQTVLRALAPATQHHLIGRRVVVRLARRRSASLTCCWLPHPLQEPTASILVRLLVVGVGLARVPLGLNSCRQGLDVCN